MTRGELIQHVIVIGTGPDRSGRADVSRVLRGMVEVTERSTRVAARLWWALLPYAGETGYADAEHPARWFAHPLTWLWKLAGKLPGSDPFKPMEPVVCTCDYCRGVPGAVFEP